MQSSFPVIGAADDDVGSGNIFGMQPRIPRMSETVGQVFILCVILADINRYAFTGGVAGKKRLLIPLFFTPFLASIAKVALFGEFLTNLLNICKPCA
ncbi:Uncharacterised protein [Mycobacterium tuberculosis]|nr:Uncharacterised protein [Mycobacterium tuberculosis]